MTGRWMLGVGLLALGLACGGGGAIGARTEGGAEATSAYPGTEEGARQLLLDVRTGDAVALTRALKPTSADYAAYFDAASAEKAEAAYEALWSDPKAVISADPENTELKLSSATTEELLAQGEAASAFPGGYREAAAHLQPGLTVYRWKYTKPGEDLGMAYDGLVYLNGHWAWFPKPWKVLR
ncbi:MAG: hypothetical protein R3F59_11480 [Myxococcota bacterium]